MAATQPAGHLGFDDDLVPDQEAGGIFAYDHVVIKDVSPLRWTTPIPHLRIS
jgi:hypothetical protein